MIETWGICGECEDYLPLGWAGTCLGCWTFANEEPTECDDLCMEQCVGACGVLK